MTIRESGRINASTIASQSFANLYNLINNRSNVPDPNDSTGVRKFVHQRLPHIGRNYQGYPFVVVRNSRPTKIGAVADLSKAFRNFNHIIEVYSNDGPSDNLANPVGAETRNNIVDAIIETLDNPTNLKTLISQRQASLEYDMEMDDEADLEGNDVFKAEFDIRFNNVLVSTI